MALYPQSFIEDVRTQADIVAVVQDTVTLKKAGVTYKGLCPFHGEKTPSFTVNRERGLFYCFGCQVGGDVIKFVELRDKVGFGEAVRTLAQRFGIPIPETRESRDPDGDAERESLLKVHEVAAGYFREMLADPVGASAREQLASRGIETTTIERLGLGFAPAYREGLKTRLLKAGYALPLLVKSGLVVQRDTGETVDRFRARVMIPIQRESGSVIAFGGRATRADQQPKYLNSPETPIYVKSRTLYGLNLSKQAIRQQGYAVLVEGYFDYAMALQGGVEHLVASCGTALTSQQAQTLRRFAGRVVLSYDPDSAGQGAAARSSELLVAEGFDVRVALLPAGEDPDAFVRRAGGEAYRALVDGASSYLDFLLDRAAGRFDLNRAEGRREFVQEMLAVAARIPAATARDQFADRLAHRARIAEEVIRTEIRKAAVAKRTTVPVPVSSGLSRMKPAERDLLSGLLHDPARAMRSIAELEDADLQGLASERLLREARALSDQAPASVPGLLLQRLSDHEAQLLSRLAATAAVGAPPADCIRALRVQRYERERAALQREIDRAQQRGPDFEREIHVLWERKKELLLRIEALNG
jgi:DNA primase